MAFYTRLLWIVLAVIIAPLYSDINVNSKTVFVAVGLAFAVAVSIWVSIFAWLEPEHLLYGAETHFEKWKMAFGTEKGLASAVDLQHAAGNPQAVAHPEEQN